MLRGIVTAGALVAALPALLAGCGGESSPSGATTVQAGPPSEIDLPVAPEYVDGRRVVAQSGCLACHQIGKSGNDGPGPNLTEIGSALTAAEIGQSIVKGPGIMPNYGALKEDRPKNFADMVAFLSSLDGS